MRFFRLVNLFLKAIFKEINRATFNISLNLKIKVGKGSIIDKGIKFGVSSKIGSYVYVGKDVVLGNNVIIGNNCSISRIFVDNNSHIESGVKVIGKGEGRITIGKETYIGINNVLDFSDNIKIGNYVHIAGPSTGIWTHSSAKQAIAGLPLNDKNKNFRPVAPVIIEDNVYIGGNCTIYPGVKIGHHSIVAPNSSVIDEVMPNTMVGGVPAKLIKNLNI